MSPPTWQQMPRLAGTSRTVIWLPVLRVKSALSVNLDRRFTPVHVVQVAAVPVAGASPGGAQRRGVVEVDLAVGGEAGVDGDALEAFLVVRCRPAACR